MPAFSVRCLFRWHSRPPDQRRFLYEERITLWQATSLDEALVLAQAEAEAYAGGEEEFLGFCQAFEMFDQVPGHGAEVYSLPRESDLDPRRYIDAFFDTDAERERETPPAAVPSAATSLDPFIALVEGGRGIEAIERFYARDVQMRENMGPPRVGRAALLLRERVAQAQVRDLRATCVRPVFIVGDTTVLRWVFEYTDAATGRATRFEELAYQRWEGGLIAEEQFFYDPAQFGPPARPEASSNT